MSYRDQLQNRRRFLAFVAGTPLPLGQQEPGTIHAPKQALNVMDFEAAARKALPPAHFGYMSTGVEDDATLRADREGFSRIYLRPRRLVDISRVDLRTQLFGTVWDTPIGLSPGGEGMCFPPEGEITVPRAAKKKHPLQFLSTATNTSVEDIGATLGRTPWYQLYPASRWEVTEKLVRRAEAAGCPVLALTVDTQAGRRTETLERAKRLDTRNCAGCHGTKPEDFFRRKPMFAGIDVAGLRTSNVEMTWEHVRRLKALTKMKLIIKGIETREDAKLCLESGVDGILVSNHGGRAEESGRGTIDCLPEVVEAAGGRIPVMLDGGIRRGTDVFKAPALGASGVFIRRAYLLGLAGFGQPGVERV